MFQIVYPLKLEYRHSEGAHTSEWCFASEEEMLAAVAEIAALMKTKLELKIRTFVTTTSETPAAD